VDNVEINGRTFGVVRVLSDNRNAVARLRDGSIMIKLPRRWPDSEKDRVAADLLKRAVRAIEKGRWSTERAGKIWFSHGQRITAMGKEFDVLFVPAGRFGTRVREGRLEVLVKESHPRKEEKASELAKRTLAKALMPELLARVKSINDAHFGASLRKIVLRDNITRWGSCSPDGSISLNLRLLLLPEDILDYVIVHELAHTKYKSHGPRFWQLVERVMPDHKERRKWLRKNGWSFRWSETNGLS